MHIKAAHGMGCPASCLRHAYTGERAHRAAYAYLEYAHSPEFAGQNHFQQPACVRHRESSSILWKSRPFCGIQHTGGEGVRRGAYAVRTGKGGIKFRNVYVICARPLTEHEPSAQQNICGQQNRLGNSMDTKYESSEFPTDETDNGGSGIFVNHRQL